MTVIQFALLVADQLQLLCEAVTVTVLVAPSAGADTLEGETVKLHAGGVGFAGESQATVASGRSSATLSLANPEKRLRMADLQTSNR